MIGLIKKHYHWVIVALILLELAVFSGIMNNITSLHIIPVTQELGINRGSFSLAYTFRPLVGFFSTLFSGTVFLKYGFRRLASLGLLISAAGFALLGVSNGLVMLTVASAIIGISEGFCTTAAASRVVNSWFHSHQGLILGLVTASTGLGGSLFSIILAGVIEAGSWRVSYLVSAVLIGIMGLLIFLLGRNRPQDMGLQPFGHGTGHGKKSRKENRDHWHGEDAKTVMRRPSFVLMLLVVFFSSTCIYAAFPVVAPHLQDCGMTAGEAASLQSIMLLSLALAKFLCGALSDWVGSKKVNLLCMGCCVVGLTLLALVNGTAVAAVAMIVFSVGVVLTTITVPLLSSSLFGYHPQGGIIGIFMALIPAANVITTPVVNMLYDRIGSYSPIFLVFAGIGLATLAAMLVLYRLAGNDRKRYEATHPTEPEE